MSQNGLLAPQATHGNPEVSYYALANGAILTNPTLVSPITIQSTDTLLEPPTITTVGENHPIAEYVGALRLAPGGNDESAIGANGVVIRAAAGPATVVEVGTDSEGPNLLLIAGDDGLGQVYDELYNPVIPSTPLVQYTGAIPANTGPGLWTFTPTRTGAYMLQVNINVANTDSIPVNGIIEWVLNVGGGEVQYVSNTLKSTAIAKASDFDEVDGAPGTLAPPTDYSFSNMCILTAGQQVSFYLSSARNSAAGGVAWFVANYQVRLMAMC